MRKERDFTWQAINWGWRRGSDGAGREGNEVSHEYLFVLTTFQQLTPLGPLTSLYLIGYLTWQLSVGLKLNAVIIFGIRFGIFSCMYFGYSWKSNMTISGHSVNTLKLSVEERASPEGVGRSGSVLTTVGLSSVLTFPKYLIMEVDRLA